ncbi:Protein kinase-like domain [Pseudocohnilembus persalinus]|uniref:Protein kinase-like domain n=1 Tax=Pseudocohnilembus persalinus TaxID=266149 RepID=A0A0V0R5J3_PSEPJ|nr:Protein kinase-like domain [Pseudocohnilembus persalinus]|eukprot:KRX09740.1 Protein kinase-like domain [Pseudocohnilembus persalinus]
MNSQHLLDSYENNSFCNFRKDQQISNSSKKFNQLEQKPKPLNSKYLIQQENFNYNGMYLNNQDKTPKSVKNNSSFLQQQQKNGNSKLDEQSNYFSFQEGKKGFSIQQNQQKQQQVLNDENKQENIQLKDGQKMYLMNIQELSDMKDNQEQISEKNVNLHTYKISSSQKKHVYNNNYNNNSSQLSQFQSSLGNSKKQNFQQSQFKLQHKSQKQNGSQTSISQTTRQKKQLNNSIFNNSQSNSMASSQDIQQVTSVKKKVKLQNSEQNKKQGENEESEMQYLQVSEKNVDKIQSFPSLPETQAKIEFQRQNSSFKKQNYKAVNESNLNPIYSQNTFQQLDMDESNKNKSILQYKNKIEENNDNQQQPVSNYSNLYVSLENSINNLKRQNQSELDLIENSKSIVGNFSNVNMRQSQVGVHKQKPLNTNFSYISNQNNSNNFYNIQNNSSQNTNLTILNNLSKKLSNNQVQLSTQQQLYLQAQQQQLQNNQQQLFQQSKTLQQTNNNNSNLNNQNNNNMMNFSKKRDSKFFDIMKQSPSKRGTQVYMYSKSTTSILNQMNQSQNNNNKNQKQNGKGWQSKYGQNQLQGQSSANYINNNQNFNSTSSLEESQDGQIQDKNKDQIENQNMEFQEQSQQFQIQQNQEKNLENNQSQPSSKKQSIMHISNNLQNQAQNMKGSLGSMNNNTVNINKLDKTKENQQQQQNININSNNNGAISINNLQQQNLQQSQTQNKPQRVNKAFLQKIIDLQNTENFTEDQFNNYRNEQVLYQVDEKGQLNLCQFLTTIKNKDVTKYFVQYTPQRLMQKNMQQYTQIQKQYDDIKQEFQRVHKLRHLERDLLMPIFYQKEKIYFCPCLFTLKNFSDQRQQSIKYLLILTIELILGDQAKEDLINNIDKPKQFKSLMENYLDQIKADKKFRFVNDQEINYLQKFVQFIKNTVLDGKYEPSEIKKFVENLGIFGFTFHYDGIVDFKNRADKIIEEKYKFEQKIEQQRIKQEKLVKQMEENYYDYIEPNNIRNLVQCKTIEQQTNSSNTQLSDNEKMTLYQKLKEFLLQKQVQILIIMGKQFSGKTFFLQSVYPRLKEILPNYQKQQCFYLDLGKFKDLQDYKIHVQNMFTGIINYYSRQSEFIVILDGYDKLKFKNNDGSSVDIVSYFDLFNYPNMKIIISYQYITQPNTNILSQFKCLSRIYKVNNFERKSSVIVEIQDFDRAVMGQYIDQYVTEKEKMEIFEDQEKLKIGKFILNDKNILSLAKTSRNAEIILDQFRFFLFFNYINIKELWNPLRSIHKLEKVNYNKSNFFIYMNLHYNLENAEENPQSPLKKNQNNFQQQQQQQEISKSQIYGNEGFLSGFYQNKIKQKIISFKNIDIEKILKFDLYVLLLENFIIRECFDPYIRKTSVDIYLDQNKDKFQDIIKIQKQNLHKLAIKQIKDKGRKIDISDLQQYIKNLHSQMKIDSCNSLVQLRVEELQKIEFQEVRKASTLSRSQSFMTRESGGVGNNMKKKGQFFSRIQEEDDTYTFDSDSEYELVDEVKMYNQGETEWQTIQYIGKGSYGDVNYIYNKRSKTISVRKEFYQDKDFREEKMRLTKIIDDFGEKEFKCYGMIFSDNVKFQQKNCIYYESGLCNLQEFFLERQRLKIPTEIHEMFYIVGKLLEFVVYFYDGALDKNIHYYHGDIKPYNIVLVYNEQSKSSDKQQLLEIRMIDFAGASQDLKIPRMHTPYFFPPMTYNNMKDEMERLEAEIYQIMRTFQAIQIIIFIQQLQKLFRKNIDTLKNIQYGPKMGEQIQI